MILLRVNFDEFLGLDVRLGAFYHATIVSLQDLLDKYIESEVCRYSPILFFIFFLWKTDEGLTSNGIVHISKVPCFLSFLREALND